MKHDNTTKTVALARHTLSFGKPLFFALSIFGVFSPSASLQGGVPSTLPTILTVTSGKDPDDSLSNTFSHPDGLHTLRRAIVQARSTTGPVEIRFNIPALAEDGYDSALGIWKLMTYNTTRTQIFRQLTGNISIDGSTQPGGRAVGPKIIIVGPGTGMKEGLIVGETSTQNNNIIRDLGFQNLRTSIYINSSNNIIQRCWFGLNNDGTKPLLRQNNPQYGSGADGISLSSGADQNQIQSNYFLGLSGVSAAVRGTGNTFANNFIGTRSDGRVTEKQTDPDLIGSPVDWLGGSGISVTDDDNVIEDNTFAGIRIQVSQWSLQADAIRVSGKGHIIRNNRIGIDGKGASIGVCGRGIYLSDSPKNLQVTENAIVNSELSAISLNGILYDANTLRGNTIRKTGSWRQVDGMPAAEDAIQVGPSLPTAFQNFKPAKVTSINGTTIRGTNGAGSPCPNAKVELFLVNYQASDAPRSLAVVTSDSNGNWIAIIPLALTGSQGIRTTTTTTQWGDIPNMGAGTTTGLSKIYTMANTSPEIVVYQPAGTSIPDNGTKSFGSVPLGTSSFRTFTIKNTGGASLTGVNITKSGANASDFTVTVKPATTVPAGKFSTFTVRFKPTATGTRNARIQIASNDRDENPFDVNLKGTGTAPEIAVQEPAGTNIGDSGFRNFGDVVIGNSTSLVFTIKNTGTASLKDLKITKTGANAPNFSVTGPNKITLNPGVSTTFKVTFTPNAIGKRVAAIQIENNDASENPFDISLSGTGVAPGQRPTAVFVTELAALSKPDRATQGTTTLYDKVDGLKYLELAVIKTPGTAYQPHMVEVSPNLVDWYSGSNHTTTVIDDASLLQVRDNTPIVPGTKRYIRLKNTR